MVKYAGINKALKEFKDKKIHAGKATIGELINTAADINIKLSDIIIAESMIQTGWNINKFFDRVLNVFNHNLRALELGLKEGHSFLLDRVARDLNESSIKNGAVLDDIFINKSIIYTLATEVGNHEMGLQPAAGTGDSCPYTGLLRALIETESDLEKVKRGISVLLKVSTIFRSGKTTTGCNMEGYGAGSTATAACLVEVAEGTPKQIEHAMVLALSPTIAVPCTPRVMVPGLCANHIASAITTGNNAAKIALNSSMRVNVDIDAMISMAAEVHKKAAPIITEINVKWMRPYFNKNEDIDKWVDSKVLSEERKSAADIKKESSNYMRNIIKNSPPIDNPFGDVVVGGSSMAVGSPTNMGRIVHELLEGEIEEIKIELTYDLFVRRAINVPGILMGAVFGAKTNDIEAYKKVVNYVKEKGIKVTINKVDTPEIQRLFVRTNSGRYMLDSRNRGGGRITIVDSAPSKEMAIKEAKKLGIVIV